MADNVVIGETPCVNAKEIDAQSACTKKIVETGKEPSDFAYQKTMPKEDVIRRLTCSWAGVGCDGRVVEKGGAGRDGR